MSRKNCRFLNLRERKRMTSACDCPAGLTRPFGACARGYKNAKAVCAAAALLLLPMQATLSPAHALEGFTVGTASVGSTPHILGTAMQQVFSEKFPDGRFEVAVTGGSIENSRMMRRGEAELGIASVTGSAMRNAWHGRNLEAGEEPFKEIRTLMGFVHIVGHLIARPGAGIENFEDIKGKRVGLGSSIRTSALHEPFWRSQGVAWIDDVEEVPLGSQDRYRFLAEGRVDAALAWTVGTKLAAIIEEYASANEAVWAKTDKAALEEAGFTVFAFEPGSLPGLDFLNHGPSLTMSALTATDELPDEAAYEIVKTLHENMEQVVLLLPAVQAAIENPAIFTSPSDPFPYHPGAIRYWKEVGLWDSE
ncbi:MAG: TAXI family TRAP transporter solute-binding subunit [Boseongicola sp. SB0675_bin_26]|nr:TAXI family TRAP transporter solute-binding subunit [Boseongicola sp. SB0675_bin_26]